MKTNLTYALLLFLVTSMICEVRGLEAAGIIFPFRYPQRDTTITGGDSSFVQNDRHATDKMIYYGYYAGQEPAGWADWVFMNRKAQFQAQTDTEGFWSVFDDCIDVHRNIVDNESWRYPKRTSRMKSTRHLDRAFLAHNIDKLFAQMIDSLISPQVAQSVSHPDSLAVEACAKYILSCDTIYRNRYDIPSGGSNDSLIIHQLCQEFNSRSIDCHDYELWMRRTGFDPLAARCHAAEVMNAIAAKLHSNGFLPSTITALETFYPEGAVANNGGTDTTWIDSLIIKTPEINVLFCIVEPGDREYYMRQINDAQTDLGSRKLGIRFSWSNKCFLPPRSHSTQVELMRDLDAYIPNKKYLTFYSGQALDGVWIDATKTFGHPFDADTHWKALAARQSKCWLVFVDQFEESGLDRRLWNDDGSSNITQTPNSDNGYIIIGQNSHIRNDSLYTGLSRVTCRIDKGDEGSSQTDEHHLMIEKGDGALNRIDMFTRKDTLYCQTVVYGTTYGVKLNETIGQGINDWQINWHSNSVYFSINGSVKHTESLYNIGATGRFDEYVRAKLLSGSTANDMKVDSVMALYKTQKPPLLQVSSTSQQGNEVFLNYAVNSDAKVWVYLEWFNWGVDFGAERRDLLYVSESDSIGSYDWQAESYLFTGSEETGNYRWMVRAENLDGGVRDSVYSAGFYFCADSTVLSAAEKDLEKPVTLPKSFTLAQNRPNPFNPSTTITFGIPQGKSGPVSIQVFNIRGQRVRILLDRKTLVPGSHSVFWDGRDDKGLPVSSGVYFYRLVAGDRALTRKMILLK